MFDLWGDSRLADANNDQVKHFLAAEALEARQARRELVGHDDVRVAGVVYEKGLLARKVAMSIKNSS